MTHKQSLVAVIGSSGSGKSSVVFAGLIPHLEDENLWLIGSFRPQSQPFYGLASALVRLLKPELDEIQQPGRAAELLVDIKQGHLTLLQVITSILQKNPEKRLLFAIDQFEELYTQCLDIQEQQKFVDVLLEAIKSFPHHFTLVLTLRADFFSYALNYLPFGEALQKYTPQLLNAMSLEEMQSAIEEPAKVAGVELEQGLTERILSDVKQEPGNLPLLEFALTELWKKQHQGKLTHKAYKDIGGVTQALTNHASKVYENLDEKKQKELQRIFLRLVHTNRNTEDTRRLATRQELGNWNLINYLAGNEARLVVTGRDERTKDETVEVVHETLIREWGYLREWINNDRAFLNWLERLRSALRQWNASDKDDGALLRGVLLAEAETWQQERLEDISQEERIFIQLSLELRDREVRESEKAKQRITVVRTVAVCLFFGLLVFFTRDTIRLVLITVNKKNLAGKNLEKIYMPEANLSQANLSQASLSRSDLTKADLSQANLEKTDFGNTYMPEAKLVDAKLSQANFSDATLTKGDFSGAKLNNANFTHSYMPEVNLQNADLSQANLSKAHLANSNVSGANFKGVKNLTPEQIKSTRNWQKAKYDEEFRAKLGLPPKGRQ